MLITMISSVVQGVRQGSDSLFYIYTIKQNNLDVVTRSLKASLEIMFTQERIVEMKMKQSTSLARYFYVLYDSYWIREIRV